MNSSKIKFFNTFKEILASNGLLSIPTLATFGGVQNPPKQTGRYPKSHTSRGPNNQHMPKYIIEREVPGAGSLTQEQLQAISQTSCGVLSEMGPQINWIHSYVTGDKIYCVYIAPNKDMVVEHAKKGGFPANAINEVATIIDPTTAE